MAYLVTRSLLEEFARIFKELTIMNIIFTGPPFAGKDTQANLLANKLGIPVFSMGKLIRDAYKSGDIDAVEGFNKYSMKGKHIPIRLKFKFLKEKLDNVNSGYIIDNFPATGEDLKTLNDYLKKKSIKIDKVFLLSISEDVMRNRIINRGRADDNLGIIMRRRVEQDKDRIPVIEYYKEKRLLVELNGDDGIDNIQKKIFKELDI